MPDFSSPLVFAATTAFFFIVILGRYLAVSAIAHLFFYRWRKNRWESRKLAKRAYGAKQFRREIVWSAVTTLIFAVAGAATLLLWQKGYTRVYEDISAFPLWYAPLSLLVAMLL